VTVVLVAFFLVSLIDLEVAIFGNNQNLIDVLPPFLFGFLFLTIIVGFAFDLERTSAEGPSNVRISG